MAIRFFIENINYKLNNKSKLKSWINDVIRERGKKTGEINYILCNDDYLIDINKKYLNHDYYTDIITFDYSEKNVISGDIYISVDTVDFNSKKYSGDFQNELYRVMVHGILHLIGFKDKTRKEKEEMRRSEDIELMKLCIE